MDSETFEIAKENDLSFEETEQLQEVIDDRLDVDEAHELWQQL